MMKRVLAGLAACMTIVPAHAQQGEWRHEQSGVAVAREIGDMRVGTVRDASNGANMDVLVQLGSDSEPVTFYVYRSAYPNPALWFERTRLAMNANIQAETNAAPRSFTLGGGTAPNGLREEIAIPTGGRFRSTAVAIAQTGEWIVKLRITSATLDVAGIRGKMDRLLAAIRMPAVTSATLPLVVPQPCSSEPQLSGQPVRDPAAALVSAAASAGRVDFAEARGTGGLAAEPAAWCRMTTELPVQYLTTYRRRDGAAWVALLGDAGRAVSAHALPGGSNAAAFASDPTRTAVAALFSALPSPDAAVLPALPAATGQSEGLATIRSGTGNR